MTWMRGSMGRMYESWFGIGEYDSKEYQKAGEECADPREIKGIRDTAICSSARHSA